MFITRFVAAFRKFRTGLQEDGLRDLPDAAQMDKVLERERTRADRTGATLSVVVFVPARHQAGEALACLVRALRGRLRLTDEIGWLDKERLCAVLPDTPTAGAWKVVEDIGQALPVGAARPRCLVYSYPGDWAAGGQPASDKVAAEQPPARPAAKRAAALEGLLLRPMPAWKRSLDVAGALTGMVLLAPLLALIAAAIKLTSPGPVLFSQRRSGRGGVPFTIYKFRTMVIGAEGQKARLLARNDQDGPAFKMKDDPRVTWLGRVLRQTSLDELPQLWNVLKGDMSLVGPRPLPCDESQACTGWQRRRLDVTPGLTCIWQVRGRCRVSFADWVRMDVRYIRQRSLWQDLKLLVLTVPAVLFRRGAQ
jgi:lipopolysaccharide/colanic/teichoic acid biosynthesis glycosyltransferase